MATRIVRQDSSVPTKVHTAIYVRVSTLNGGQNQTLRTRELKEYCLRRGWQVIARRLDVSVDLVFAAANGVCLKNLIEDELGAGR